MNKDLFANVSLERKRGSATQDSVTGKVYPSRNKTYQALAQSLRLNPDDQYGWYTICRMFPERFLDVRTGRYIDRQTRQPRLPSDYVRWQPVSRPDPLRHDRTRTPVVN